MTTTEKKAVSKIRAALGLKRLDPRRLYSVSDGAYTWIGDRADLNTADARYLAALHRWAENPSDRKPAVLEAEEDDEHYSDVCSRCTCFAATHGGAGIVSWDDLPEDWQDGSALGPILPL